MAAGRCNLPAVVVCWMKEGCEAGMKRWMAGECWPADAGRVVVG